MPDTPLNPDALEAARFALTPSERAFGRDGKPADPLHIATAIVSAYLAVAQQEVNSVESIPAHVQVISWEEEPEHECWKLAPDETFVGLIVKSDRAWSPADRYTLNIERPEVNDGR